MPSLSAYHLTWVSLTMDMGYLLLVTAPDLGCEVALLGHSCTTQLLLNSKSWWWTGRPGILLFMGSQRVGHDWATELNWDHWMKLIICSSLTFYFYFFGPFGIQVIYLTFLSMLPCLLFLFCFVFLFCDLRIVKFMVFPVVMHGLRIGLKKAECGRINAFELWSWRKLLRVLWTVRRSNQSVQKEIYLENFSGGLMLKLKLQNLGHLMQRSWC